MKAGLWTGGGPVEKGGDGESDSTAACATSGLQVCEAASSTHATAQIGMNDVGTVRERDYLQTQLRVAPLTSSESSGDGANQQTPPTTTALRPAALGRPPKPSKRICLLVL